MKKFKLEIEMGNEAMQSHLDVSEILADISIDLLNNTKLDSWTIMDENGNTVGKWWFE